jgi:hypothetical protein
MTEEEIATAEALRAEYDRLEQAHAEDDELPEETDQRLGEIETALAALDERPVNTILTRSRAPASSSALTGRVNCGSSAATSVPRTNLQVRKPSRRAARRRTASKPPLRMLLKRRMSAHRHRKSVRKRTSRASSRSLTG